LAFNSLNFLLLLAATFLVYYHTRATQRWVVLLAAGIVFYSALQAPHLLAALAVVCVQTYYCGLWLRRVESEARRRTLFRCAVLANVLVLVCVRYIPFLTGNLNSLLGYLGLGAAIPVPEAIVSVGVSFYVFQAISYLSDVYLETAEPEPHLGHFALYLAFFAKLLQGPIERAGDLLPQLKAPAEFSYQAARSGLFLFATGLFKKVAVADRLALLVDPIYSNVHAHTGLALIVATACYAFQIYFDFSAYTDMAMGAARLLGIELTNNFNSPYLARSVPDFWRRWHITFTRFILDYIFRPIQLYLRDRRVWGTVVALSVTFLASGLWHGARWNFVIWGALHGVYMVGSVLAAPHLKRLYRGLRLENTKALALWQVAATFVLVSLAWVFFRAAGISDALYVVSHLLSGMTSQVAEALAGPTAHSVVKGLFKACFPTVGAETVATAMLAVGLLELLLASSRPGGRVKPVLDQPVWVRWVVYVALVVAVMDLGVAEKVPFAYFQF